MKTTVKQIVAGTFIALLLMVGNAKAVETKVSGSEMIECTMELENWMTNDMIWDVHSLNIADFAKETEASMELENWMTNTDSWSLKNNCMKEIENKMELESWMTNESTWNTVAINTESELTVEPWMTNENLWI